MSKIDLASESTIDLEARLYQGQAAGLDHDQTQNQDQTHLAMSQRQNTLEGPTQLKPF